MSDLVWNILIVDDEPEIHTVTKLVMGRENILGRNLRFLDAMNGDEARELLHSEPDIALILLDVVMSTDNDGLELAKWIRDELNNKIVRIVLRTGNPGEAPEMEVITGYDINDYKEKAELTAKKLRTLFYTSLRSYRDLMVLEHYRRGLVRVVSSLADLYGLPSLEEFIAGVLEQIASSLFLDHGAMYGVSSGIGAFHTDDDKDFHIVAATGKYQSAKGSTITKVLPPNLLDLASTCNDGTQHLQNGDTFIQCMEIAGHGTALLMLMGVTELTDEDRSLLKVFTENAAYAFHRLAERQNSLEN